jgi:hypothetical protein
VLAQFSHSGLCLKFKNSSILLASDTKNKPTMKIIYTAILMILTSTVKLPAQAAFSKVEIKKGFPKYAFKYGELNVGVLEVASIVKKNEQAYKVIKKARSNHNWAMFFGAVGIGGLMAPLQLLIPPLPNENRRENSGKYVLTFIGIGLSGFAIAVPLSIKAEKQAAKAVELYNSGLGSNLYKHKPYEFTLRATYNGLGIVFEY